MYLPLSLFLPSLTIFRRRIRATIAPAAKIAYRPAPESFILAALCLLDLSSTIWWVAYRSASEGNPLMAYYLAHGGFVGFALVKIVLFIAPLFITEWARQKHPRFVRAALRVGAAAYAGLYLLGVAHVNADGDDSVPLGFPAPAVQARLVKPFTPVPAAASALPGLNSSACDKRVARLVQDKD